MDLGFFCQLEEGTGKSIFKHAPQALKKLDYCKHIPGRSLIRSAKSISFLVRRVHINYIYIIHVNYIYIIHATKARMLRKIFSHKKSTD